MITRRGFLKGVLAACTAPAIVRASSLMPIAVPKLIVPDTGLILSNNLALPEAVAGIRVYGRYNDDVYARSSLHSVGDVYFNTTTKCCYIFDGRSWRQMQKM